jgi:hypothetical protein
MSSSTPRPTNFSRGHFPTVVTVPHEVLVEDMRERIPLRAALHRHDDEIVRGADLAVVEHAGIGVGAGAQHDVDGIEPAERGIVALASLRPLAVIGQRQ